MKRTLSHEAAVTVSRMRDQGFSPAVALPSRGGLLPSLAVFGLAPERAPGWAEVRQAFVARLRQYPPERHPEEFVHIVDAYDTLKRHFRSVAGCQQEDAVAASCAAPAAAKRRRGLNGGSVADATVVAAAGPIAVDAAGVVHASTSSATCRSEGASLPPAGPTAPPCLGSSTPVALNGGLEARAPPALFGAAGGASTVPFFGSVTCAGVGAGGALFRTASVGPSAAAFACGLPAGASDGAMCIG
eukprot:TRINITY_DN32123_c0_g1_i2.p1 TRINITY_DN32123_c0_g1~~TRINITY_DN32123_c0_g1_i2.p1  ORF type:complete len:244 (-),score=54.40 TRINITY_DN32123_c0_g1_i2:123-854(-)